MAWRESDWYFLTSHGMEMTAGSGFVFGGTSGSIFLTNRRTRRRIELTYAGFGVGMAAGPPLSVSLSTRDMPCGGFGPILKNARPHENRVELSPAEFAGLFVVGNLQYSSLVEGKSASAVFFNIPPLEFVAGATGFGQAANALTAAVSAGSVNPLLDSAKAMGIIWGTSLGIQGASAGAMYYYGYFVLRA